MPWRIGGRGTNGCSGYPVVDEKGRVVGCHTTRAEALGQQRALYASEPEAAKNSDKIWTGSAFSTNVDNK